MEPLAQEVGGAVVCPEIWGLILVLQAAVAVHVGVENLYEVKHIDRLLQGVAP